VAEVEKEAEVLKVRSVIGILVGANNLVLEAKVEDRPVVAADVHLLNLYHYQGNHREARVPRLPMVREGAG
jgi:hypothetical protein